MHTWFYEKVKERLIRYAKIDTQSQVGSQAVPTTMQQFDLARMLRDELKSIGASEVFLDEKCCVVYAKLPSSGRKRHDPEGRRVSRPWGSGRPFGLIAHMDTAPDASGQGVKPWVLENYGGGDITLNEKENIIMRASDFQNLRAYIGQDLILTDGTTLLGGDDKASIAAIMTFAEYLLQHPELPHPLISLAFTPDEEVGGLARDLDLARLGVPVAYTLDGDHLGWYQDETFNASEAVINIVGRSVHTGTAKGIMVNAADIAAKLISMLPENERPQTTEGREGFYHVVSCESVCEHAKIRLIIRDHDSGLFAKREAFIGSCCEELNRQYGTGTVSLQILPTYRNMKEVIDTVPDMIQDLRQAITDAGLTPVCEPFRGGTDGSALSHRGLPCPNLSAGYENAHGRFEYVPIQSMEKNVEILLALAALRA